MVRWFVGCALLCVGWGGGPSSVAAEPARHARIDPAWQLSVLGGLLLPRGDLLVGPVVGCDVQWRPAAAGSLAVTVGLDWSSLANSDSVLFAPPTYPRSEGALSQESSVFTLRFGARYRLLRAGVAQVDAGAWLGASASRSTFVAYSQTRQENAVAPVVAVEVGAGARSGHVAWRLFASWRETSHRLHESGELGEEQFSGGTVGVTLGMAL